MLKERKGGGEFSNLHQMFHQETPFISWIKNFRRVYKGLSNVIQAIEGGNKV